MRILLVTAEYPPGPCGGIGIFYRELGRQLRELGADIRVLTAGSAADEQENCIQVSRLPARNCSPRLRIGGRSFDVGAVGRSRDLASAARRLVREVRPDIVETHDWSAPLWSPPSRPFVVRLHGASSVLSHARDRRAPRLMHYLERRMLAQASAVIAVSKWAQEKSAEVFGLDREDIEVIPNGVDTERFQPGAGERREEIVFAGTLREDKGVLELLQALEVVFRQRPAAVATFAGGPDAWSDLPPRIRALTEHLQAVAPSRLRLLGRVGQAQLADLYRRAGVCVFPSHVEAFGLACVEAMSCGAPVIASVCGAGVEIVEDGCSGLLADARDPAVLASAISRLLARPDLGRELGAAARLRAVEKYSIRLTAERTLRFYEHAVKANQPWRKQNAA